MLPLNKILMITPVHSIKPPVITRAIRLAQDAQAQLTLFSVTDEQPMESTAWQSTVPVQEHMMAKLEKAQSTLQQTAQQYCADYANIDTANVIGVPFIEIVKKVKHDNYDFVVVASKESEHCTKRFLDSNVMHLMRKCPSPVWAVGEHETPNIKRIVAPIDVYAPTEAGMALNNRILQWAAKLATQQAAELHIIHVWQQPNDDDLKGWGFTSEIERCETVMKEKHDRQTRLDAMVNNNISPSLKPHTQLITGVPQEAICEYLDEHDADLVVMGTVCHTGIPGFFIGNVAESVLSEVSCSVLALKPDGFISPVN
ncbi:MAG: universal stress protein E [Phenylobacterium sp.]|jgi:universal stress protein E